MAQHGVSFVNGHGAMGRLTNGQSAGLLRLPPAPGGGGGGSALLCRPLSRERTPLSGSSTLRERTPLSGASTLREMTPLRSTSTLREMSPRAESLSRSVVLTSAGGRPRPGGPGGSVFRAVPAGDVSYTQSFGLSKKIDQFLKRSDHSMDSWKKLTRRRSRAAAEPPARLGRARSSAAIVMRSLYREVSDDAGRQVRALTRDRSVGTVADVSEIDTEVRCSGFAAYLSRDVGFSGS